MPDADRTQPRRISSRLVGTGSPEFARAQVGYKAPEEIVFLDEIPLNPTGKVDQVALKRLTEDHLHPHGIS